MASTDLMTQMHNPRPLGSTLEAFLVVRDPAAREDARVADDSHALVGLLCGGGRSRGGGGLRADLRLERRNLLRLLGDLGVDSRELRGRRAALPHQIERGSE